MTGHEIGNHTYSHRRMVFVSPGSDTGHRRRAAE
jgi:peptidoglycan/xylan/chitin deacetylase (PgdA/CDA1 family)